MYLTRKIKFHNGKCTDGINGKMNKDTYLFSEHIDKLCVEANLQYGVRAKFIGIKEDSDNNWTIKIKVNNKDYFNVIALNFIKYFNDVISAVEY